MPLKDKDIETLLNNYYKKRDKCKTTFPCPRCNKVMTSKQYKDHCESCLKLNPKLECIWCQGKTSWTKNTKCKNAQHFIDCWKRFITHQEELAQSAKASTSQFFTENVIVDDLEHYCSAQQLFGHAKLADILPQAYEPIFPMELDAVSLPFQDKGMNLAIACIQKYLKLCQNYDFFHCMVKAAVFDQFYLAMENDQGQSRLLPFSCWCNGGKEMKPLHRHHRHMILVSPQKGRFHDEIWKKIKVPQRNRPFKSYRCLLKKQITSPMHLLNTMGYVSKRASQCNGTFDRNKQKKLKERLNHFWIMTALPKNFQLAVALQWKGGLMELVRQKYRHVKPDVLARAPIENKMGRFQIPIKDLPGMELNRVLPVSKEFKPTRQGPTEHMLHLNQDKKLYFEKDESLKNLDDDAWGKTQANLGNVFYGAVGKDLWTPKPFQQMCLHCIESYRVENVQLKELLSKKEAEMSKKEMDHLKEQLKQKIEMDHLKETITQKEIEMARLKGILEEKNRGSVINLNNTTTNNNN